MYPNMALTSSECIAFFKERDDEREQEAKKKEELKEGRKEGEEFSREEEESV